MKILEVSRVYFQYPAAEAPTLADVSFDLSEGELLYVLGGPQSGKSTLAMVISGIIPGSVAGDFEGQVLVSGAPIQRDNIDGPTTQVGIVFQDPDAQLVEMRVEDEIASALENVGICQDEMKKRVWNAMEQVQITHLARRDPARLSGGEKQRVCIAAAIALQPQVLVFDEPFTDLDADGVDRLWSQLREIRTRLRLSIVILDKRVPQRVDEDFKVLVLSRGRIVLQSRIVLLWGDVEFWRQNRISPPILAEIAEALNIRVSRPLSLAKLIEIARLNISAPLLAKTVKQSSSNSGASINCNLNYAHTSAFPGGAN